MTEGGLGSTRQNSRHPTALTSELPPTDCVDPASKQMEPTNTVTVLDLGLREAEIE